MTIKPIERNSQDLLRLIQAEYNEMPGLHLTKPQIQRLWQLDAVVCDTVLDVLMATHVLRKTDHDAYVLDSNGVVLH